MSEYNHTEQPDSQLRDRRQELGKLLGEVPYGLVRRYQVASELAYVLFEEAQRVAISTETGMVLWKA